MADLVDRPRLLPATALPIPVALTEVDGRLDDVDMGSIVDLKDARKADAGFLRFLAWEASVDVYDAAWPDEVKRAVILAAPIVHRYKGTRYAVATALAALGISSEIVEWWQTAPRGAPYTFRVTAVARGRLYDGPLLDARLTRIVFAAIEAAKPKSRAFSLSVAAGMTARVGLTPVSVVRVRVPVAVHPLPFNETFARRLASAPVIVARARIPLSFHPLNSEAFASKLGAGCVAVARVRVAASMRASSL